MIYHQDEALTLLLGDAREQLASLPADSVQTAVTSPPYWGLRDYGVSGQLGLEPTLTEYLAGMIDVFRQIHRVLRPDGSLWLNMGDAYNSGTSAKRPPSKTGSVGHWKNGGKLGDERINAPGLKVKDLIGTPWRVALALQEDGWWHRGEIIWHKTNASPETNTVGRPTRAHEYIFQLSKTAHPYYDVTALREKASPSTHSRAGRNGQVSIGPKSAPEGQRIKNNESFNAAMGQVLEMRNARSVWSFPTVTSGDNKHFATFPEELPRRCILAGSREGDVVLDPFLGTGTTGAVALSLGRAFVGVELSEEYMEGAYKRLLGKHAMRLGI